MKLPSLTNLLNQAKETFARFPLAIISSILGAFVMIRILGFSPDYYKEQSHFWYNLAMTFSLALPLFIATSLFVELKEMKSVYKYIFQLIPIGILLLFYFTLSADTDFYDIGRYLLYLIAFHLLVSFSSNFYSSNSSQKDFWDFNQIIFLRIILSGLYSIVLYGGLAIALLSFDKLFDMEIDGKRYAQLFFFIVGIFNTWFFCSGIPVTNRNGELTFPKGVKIFTQYVLLPIIVIYVIILYLYLFKIIFNWNLPVGWVSYLVIGFSTAGIFSLLLIFPLVDSNEIKWVRLFSRIFFISLIPQIILLYIAISARTTEYGITERRYYVYVLAFWLTITTIIYVIRNFRNIKYIPISLFIIAILTSAGPWGAFNLSLNSQLNRLEEVLNKNSILSGGKITPVNKSLEKEELQDVRSILSFLIERNKLSKIQPWFDNSLDSLKSSRNNGKHINGIYMSKEEQILLMMGIKSESTESFTNKKFLTITTQDTKEIQIQGYEKLMIFESSVVDSSGLLKLRFDFQNSNIVFSEENDTLIISALDVAKSIDTVQPQINKMTIQRTFRNNDYNIIITNMNFERQENGIKITSLKAYILSKKSQSSNKQ